MSIKMHCSQYQQNYHHWTANHLKFWYVYLCLLFHYHLSSKYYFLSLLQGWNLVTTKLLLIRDWLYTGTKFDGLKDDIFCFFIHLLKLYPHFSQLNGTYMQSFIDCFDIKHAIIIISDVAGCSSLPNQFIFSKCKKVFAVNCAYLVMII